MATNSELVLYEAAGNSAYKKDGERLFMRAGGGRARGNSFTLEEGGFRLDI